MPGGRHGAHRLGRDDQRAEHRGPAEGVRAHRQADVEHSVVRRGTGELCHQGGDGY